MTLPANLPEAFRTAARDFADKLRASFASGMPAQPEDQLKGPVQALLATVTHGVLTKTEAHVHDLGGRPDIGVEVRKALCGFVELKAPGLGAQTKKLKDRDKRQWNKFSALPNILYTDALEWALYRTGVQSEQDKKPILIRLDGIMEKGAAALDDTTLAALHTLLLDFLSWQPIVPHEPRKLAEMLAPLCRLLRADVFAAVEREGSALAHLCAEIRQYLFPHTDHKEFADIYAQTLTYALLLARLENADGQGDLHAEDAAKRLDSGHGLLAQTLRILTQPEARAEIETAVSVLARVIAAVEPRKLAKHGDPWIYFYEHFLAAYDNRLRLSYGVVYTPQEVIGCQVALVSELLADRFGKPLSATFQSLYPARNKLRQACDYLPANEHFVHIPHVEHVHDPAEVAAPAVPPGVARIKHEVVQNVHVLAVPQFLQLHPIEQGFIDPIGYPAAERRGVVIFLHLPNRDGIDRRGKSSIHAAGQSPQRCATCGHRREFPRVVVHRMPGRMCLDEHVHDACKICFGPFRILLFVHRQRTARVELAPQTLEFRPRLLGVHQGRLRFSCEHSRTLNEISGQHFTRTGFCVEWKVERVRLQAKRNIRRTHFLHRWNLDGASLRVAAVLANAADCRPERFRQFGKLRIRNHGRIARSRLATLVIGRSMCSRMNSVSTKLSKRSPDSYLLTND